MILKSMVIMIRLGMIVMMDCDDENGEDYNANYHHHYDDDFKEAGDNYNTENDCDNDFE